VIDREARNKAILILEDFLAEKIHDGEAVSMLENIQTTDGLVNLITIEFGSSYGFIYCFPREKKVYGTSCSGGY